MSQRTTPRPPIAHDDDERSPPGEPRVEDVPLWPAIGGAAMRVVLPSPPRASPSPAIVVLRGGGYVTNAGSGGGSAEWAAAHGMVGIEVPYRTQGTGDAYPAPYDDAARAMRIARHRAAEWGNDPNRIGLMGYSAGGHLAWLLSTRPALRQCPDDDLAPHVSARPDLVILAYPVISFVDRYAPGAYAGSATSFFGRSDLDEPLRRQFSNELHVDGTHPPVFVWTTEDDELVPCTHAVRFVEACRRANVPVTFTLFAHGPHGLGLAEDVASEVRTWTSLLRDWLAAQWPVD